MSVEPEISEAAEAPRPSNWNLAFSILPPQLTFELQIICKNFLLSVSDDGINLILHRNSSVFPVIVG